MSEKQKLYIDIFAGCGGLSIGLLKSVVCSQQILIH